VALLLLLLAALRKINLNAISDITFSLLGMHIEKKVFKKVIFVFFLKIL